MDVGLPTAVISQILPCTSQAGPQSGACSGLLDRITEIRDDLDRKAVALAANRDALTRYLGAAAIAAHAPQP